MISILDFSTEDARDKMLTGTQKNLIHTLPKHNTVYDLGTDFPCPKTPPYSYKSSVAVEDFDINNLTLSLNTKSADKTKWYVQYSYKYSDGSSGPLNISFNKILIAKYGLKLPTSEIFENVPPNFNPANKFFDKAVDAGAVPSANCSIEVEFNEDTDPYMRNLLSIFSDIRKLTARFFLKGDGKELLDDRQSRKITEAKTEKDVMNALDFEEITSKRKKDGKTVKYFDVLTYFDKPAGSNVVKMNIKGHFYGADEASKTTHDIHPSWCIRNETHYSPVIYLQKGCFSKKYFNFKMMFNDIGVTKILQWSGKTETPQQTRESLLKLFATEAGSTPVKEVASKEAASKETSSPKKSKVKEEPTSSKKKETVKAEAKALAPAATKGKKGKEKTPPPKSDSDKSSSSSSSDSD